MISPARASIIVRPAKLSGVNVTVVAVVSAVPCAETRPVTSTSRFPKAARRVSQQEPADLIFRVVACLFDGILQQRLRHRDREVIQIGFVPRFTSGPTSGGILDLNGDRRGTELYRLPSRLCTFQVIQKGRQPIPEDAIWRQLFRPNELQLAPIGTRSKVRGREFEPVVVPAGNR
jgi:hypothetical protein